MIDAKPHGAQRSGRGDIAYIARAGHGIGFRQRREGYGAGIDPDARHAFLLAHGHIVARSLERHDNVVLPDGEQQLVGIVQRAEKREIRAAKIGSNWNFGRRCADFDIFQQGSLLRAGRQGKRRRLGRSGLPESET